MTSVQRGEGGVTQIQTCNMLPSWCRKSLNSSQSGAGARSIAPVFVEGIEELSFPPQIPCCSTPWQGTPTTVVSFHLMGGQLNYAILNCICSVIALKMFSSSVLNKRASMIQQMLFSHSIVFMEWSNGGNFTCSMIRSGAMERSRNYFWARCRKRSLHQKFWSCYKSAQILM